MESKHALTFGSLDFNGSPAFAPKGYCFQALADGTNWGSPDPVVAVVTSLLADGDRVDYDRDGNRVVTIRVQVSATNGGALAWAEAALRSETRKANTIVWTPPDGWGPPTVFEVVTSWMAHEMDDLAELLAVRTYTLTLTCAPYGRSASPTIVPALVNNPGAAVVVDECNAATGWTAFHNATPATVVVEDAAAVKTSGVDPTKDEWTLKRTGAVNFSTNRYLVGEVRTMTGDVGAQGYLALTGFVSTGGASVPMTTVSVRRLTDNPNYFQVIWDTGGVTAESLTFVHTQPAPGALWIRRLTAQPSASTSPPRQQTRIITPEGTERTPVSIHVQANNGTDNLGMAFVHSCPEDDSGYSPMLRRHRISGNAVSVGSDTLSGESEPLGVTPFVADIPNDSLPAGCYALVARIKASAAVTVSLSWQASSWFLPTSNSQGIVGDLAPYTFPAGAFYQMVPLTVLSLPTVRGAGMTRISISYTGAFAGTLTLDEAWLFRADDDCALTIVTDDLPHLWCDSAGLDSPVPTVWRGTSNDRHTARHPGESLASMGSHVLSAGGTRVTTAAVTDLPKTDFEYYDRWHSHAAR